MERKARAMSWLRSAYLVFGMIFVGLVGGLAEIISLSDEVNRGLINLLENDSAGIQLNGRYLYPRNWLTLFIFCFSLLMLFPITTLLRILTENEKPESTEAQTTAEISGLRQDLDDTMRYAANITRYIYSADDQYVPRLNISSANVVFTIDQNGDTESEIILNFTCVKDPAHFYIHWIRADPESGEVKFLRQLNINAIDLDTGQKLDWLPLRNDATDKALAVFFPEVRPGEERRIKLNYRWPRFMAKLVDLGASNFDWAYRSQNPTIQARFRSEWRFDNSYTPLQCRIVGRPASTATLRSEKLGSQFSWIYEDEEAFISEEHAVEFSKVTS